MDCVNQRKRTRDKERYDKENEAQRARRAAAKKAKKEAAIRPKSKSTEITIDDVVRMGAYSGMSYGHTVAHYHLK